MCDTCVGLEYYSDGSPNYSQLSSWGKPSQFRDSLYLAVRYAKLTTELSMCFTVLTFSVDNYITAK